MIIINKTIYANNFTDTSAAEVYLLDSQEATSAFDIAFGKSVKGYFDFPNDHWFVAARKSHIGRWMEAYNTDDSTIVQSILKNAVTWAPSEDVYYLAKRSVIFNAHWGVFLTHWGAFLASEDDATIVMKDLRTREALMFTAPGDIFHVIGQHT